MIGRIQPVNDVKRELHKNIAVCKGKQKSYAEIVRGCSSKNKQGPEFFRRTRFDGRLK